MRYQEINSILEIEDLLQKSESIQHSVVRDIDFTNYKKELNRQWSFRDSIFLGCTIPMGAYDILYARDCIIFPKLDVVFNPYRDKLYSPDELFSGYSREDNDSYNLTLDKRIYDSYDREYNGNIMTSLAIHLHDQSITDSLYKELEPFSDKSVVAVMGGHNLLRGSKDYNSIVSISKKLTEIGYIMLSGGGPGAMEATHLGAWFAGADESLVEAAISTLSEAPSYRDREWLSTSFKAKESYNQTTYRSIGIPTWFYGHEPPTIFATDIAKYFTNSIREEILLALAKGGIIFAPGDAGTIQEIFQETAQNHYLSYGIASPMIFFNQEYWEQQVPIYPLIKEMADRGKYQNMILSLHSDTECVIEELKRFSKE